MQVVVKKYVNICVFDHELAQTSDMYHKNPINIKLSLL